MFTLLEITLHNKTKWELVYTTGKKHIAYFNDKGEAHKVLYLLKKSFIKTK